MIELSHVTKTFGGKKALDELSLRVPQGAVYGLIGSNGAGKSTAIRHLTGIYRPDAGTVTIGGLPVYENPEIKSRIGYIPDDLGVLGGGTIRELAAFYRTMYPRFDVARFDALREVFRLDERTPDNNARDLRAEEPERAASMRQKLMDFYYTSQYLLHNNGKEHIEDARRAAEQPAGKQP